MADAPAATLLHLGPGLGNGLANLHNARRARVPVVNIVGDHATYHTQYDAPLQSDIETVARNVSTWVRTSNVPGELAQDAAEAVQAAIGPPGQVATLILPADVSWSDGAEPVTPSPPPPLPSASHEVVEAAAGALRGRGSTGILLGGRALREGGLRAAARIAAGTGAKLFAEVFPTRVERGLGLPAIERIAYVPELAMVQLSGLKHLLLVDARPRFRSSPIPVRGTISFQTGARSMSSRRMPMTLSGAWRPSPTLSAPLTPVRRCNRRRGRQLPPGR